MTKPTSTEKARLLRRKMTDEEKILWRSLRAKRFAEFKFRRQEPIGPFIVDFVCFERKLIIEIDGDYHAKTQDYDKYRSLWLESQGFTVIRFRNDMIYTKQDQILESIRFHLEATNISDEDRGLVG